VGAVRRLPKNRVQVARYSYARPEWTESAVTAMDQVREYLRVWVHALRGRAKNTSRVSAAVYLLREPLLSHLSPGHSPYEGERDTGSARKVSPATRSAKRGPEQRRPTRDRKRHPLR
jgi:hypothetical protein